MAHRLGNLKCQIFHLKFLDFEHVLQIIYHDNLQIYMHTHLPPWCDAIELKDISLENIIPNYRCSN